MITIMKALIHIVDTASNNVAKISQFLCVILVLIMSLEVVMRYAFNSPTMWAYQTSMMIGATIYALSWAWIHRENRHIRIDVLYAHLSPRKQALIDIIGAVFLFLPLMFVFIQTALGWTIRSWTIQEKMGETYWMPPAYYLRTIVLFGVILFVIQGLAQLFRSVYILVKNKSYD